MATKPKPKAPSLTDEQRAIRAISRRIYDNSVLAYEEQFKKANDSKDLPPAVQRVTSYLKENSFGQYQSAVIKLMSAVLDHDLSMLLNPESDSIKLGEATVIVPIANSNNHNYTIGQPVYVTGSQFGIKLDGSTGNNLDTKKSSLRIPTYEEVEAIVSANYTYFKGVYIVI